MFVLVTGGGGFLGRHICELLLARGHQVRSVARGDYPALRERGVQTLRGDLALADDARRAVEGVDAVIHTAACVGVWGPLDDFIRGNVTATANLLDACREHGVGRLVFTSSPSVTFDGSSAQGAGPDLPYPSTFMAYYPQTKAQAERLALEADSPTLRTVSLRPHLIYGPGDPHLIPRLLARARAGRLRIVGPGDNRVDLTLVDHAAQAHLDALDALGEPGQPACAGRAYFISDDAPVALWEWLNALFARVGVPPVTRKVPLRAALIAGAAAEAAWRLGRLGGEPPMTRFVASQLATSHWYDMGPARRDLGYSPHVSPSEALDRLVRDIQARGL